MVGTRVAGSAGHRTIQRSGSRARTKQHNRARISLLAGVAVIIIIATDRVCGADDGRRMLAGQRGSDGVAAA